MNVSNPTFNIPNIWTSFWRQNVIDTDINGLSVFSTQMIWALCKAEHGSIRGWSGSEPADQEHFFSLIQIRTDQICTDPDHFGSICGWSAVENKKKVNNQYLRWMLMDQCHIGYRVLSMLCLSVYPKSEQKPAHFTGYWWFTRPYCMWLSHFWAQLYVQYLSHGSI